MRLRDSLLLLLSTAFCASLGVLTLGIAGNAGAAQTLTITYDLTSGSIVAGPESVTFLPGSLQIQLPAQGLNTPIAGTGLLKSLSINGSGTYQSYGSFQTTVGLPFAMDVSALGLGGTAIRNQAPFSIFGQLTVHCLGSAYYCAYTGYVQSSPAVLPATFKIPASGFQFSGTAGSAIGMLVTQSISGSLSTFAVTVNFVGMEVSRVLPEPEGTEWAALIALAVMAGVVRWRARANSPVQPNP